jgi:hypothetical protein
MSVLMRFVIISRISMLGDRAMVTLRNERNQDCAYVVDTVILTAMPD